MRRQSAHSYTLACKGASGFEGRKGQQVLRGGAEVRRVGHRYGGLEACRREGRGMKEEKGGVG